MSEMESYQVCVGPADQGGPDDFVAHVQAESEQDACFRAGVLVMFERGFGAADYIVKSCVTQAQFMADQFRVPGYAALVDTRTFPPPMDEYEEPPVEEYDPGPEVDDQGGMSEYQYFEPAGY